MSCDYGVGVTKAQTAQQTCAHRGTSGVLALLQDAYGSLRVCARVDEIIACTCQGPMSKPKGPPPAKLPAPAPAPTTSTSTTTNSSRTSANVAAGGGGQGKGGEGGSSPAGYVPFDQGARQPRLVSSPAPVCSSASSPPAPECSSARCSQAAAADVGAEAWHMAGCCHVAGHAPSALPTCVRRNPCVCTRACVWACTCDLPNGTPRSCSRSVLGALGDVWACGNREGAACSTLGRHCRWSAARRLVMDVPAKVHTLAPLAPRHTSGHGMRARLVRALGRLGFDASQQNSAFKE